ncbi:MAG: hypothetical protein NT166_12295 [Candidatus Aminicenantes bacterium]|nr:hypothetical protein [Candidatus Aminicenantes bacterium]
MNKIRFGFLAIVLIISIAAVLTFNIFKTPALSKIGKVSDFKITQVAGSGGLYVDKNPIDRGEIFLAQKVDIKEMLYADDIYLATDQHTAFEFYCSGVSFKVLPDSYLHYRPGTGDLEFSQGEFLWRKEITDSLVEVSIPPTFRVITLSIAGKAGVAPAGVKIWNYAGELKFKDGGESFSLQPNTVLTTAKNQKTSTAYIFEAPGFISPEEKVIIMDQPGDSVVKFNWKVVNGAQRYIFRLYSSNLMENILYEKEVDANRLNLDLLQFEDFGTFYWQVCANDPGNGREGSPSQMGVLKLTGALFNRENVLKPPELTIKSLDVNGNLVLIEGITDKNAQLYVNNSPVQVNPDGTFIHTIHFTKIGKYKITFRVVSASGSETTLEKFATIYDE